MARQISDFDSHKTIYLIDGSSFLYRAFYSLPPLHSPSGEPIQAVFGFCRMVKKLLDTANPEYIAVVWDSKGGSAVRKELYAEYKATRQAPPSGIFEQKERIKEFAELIGLAQIEQIGIEADDLMYSVARDQEKAGYTVVLVTSDKDMGQCLSESIIMYDTFKDQIIDAAALHEKMGFSSDKLTFYFALLGDASDNIPGVAGIGKQGALELVQQFASLDDVYQNLEKVAKPRVRNALQANKDNAFLSQKLFTLHYHATGLDADALLFDMNAWAQARDFFAEFGFKSLLKEVSVSAQVATSSRDQVIETLKKYQFITVTTQQQLDDMCVVLAAAPVCALDTETSGIDPWSSELIGLSFCVSSGTAYYVPIGHNTGEQQLSRDVVIAALKPILQAEYPRKWFHHAKFDMLVLHNAGIIVRGLAFDSLVAANILVEDWQKIGLKNLSQHYLHQPMLTWQDVVKDNKYKDFSYVPLELATWYAAADAHQTFNLVLVFQELFKKNPDLAAVYSTIEFPLVEILVAMEIDGIRLDVSLLKELDRVVSQRLIALHEEIIGLVGDAYATINLNSPKQVEELLFTHLQLPPQKKSSKGAYSTDYEVLVALSDLHPVPRLLVQYRELAKLKSTYIDALPRFVDKKRGTIHTTFNQVITATGRLASADPNLQNIPADATGYGIEVRAAFKPQEGHVFISADYSHIELRVVAHASGDQTLTEAFLQGRDIHAQTAAGLFGVALEQVTHEQRQTGKRINFTILYGSTPYGLSKDLGIAVKDAKTYIDRYFAHYPGVLRWMDDVVASTKELGYTQTLYGRRRYVPAIYESNKTLYEEARRIAINTVAQGTAADIIKIGMIRLQAAFKEQNLDATMVLQIHDELLVSTPHAQQEKTQAVVKQILEGITGWTVPLEVKTRVGKDWKEVTK